MLLAGPGEVPAFDRFQVAELVPDLTTLLDRASTAFAELEISVAPTFIGSVARLTAITEPLWWAWGVVNHLMGVGNSPELRAAHAQIQPRMVDLGLRIGQSRALYAAYCTLRDSPTWATLPEIEQRIVGNAMRDMELAGVGLEGSARERFQALERDLAELQTSFSNRVLDATKAYSLILSDPREVDGLPASWRARAAAAAGGDVERGPWQVTLDTPSYLPVMEHARARQVREQLYRAFVTRAADGELDNQPVISRLLALRAEKATLLGKSDFVAVSLAAKMAPGASAVDALLAELRTAARPKALAELEELTAFARHHGHIGDLALWDVPFWAERLREQRYAYTDEEVRPFFALPAVLDGLFAVLQRLFGVSVRAADGSVPVWHPDVRFFTVHDGAGVRRAAFYLDPYSRPADKRGGAWMDVSRDRYEARTPVAYLVCNQTPPLGDTPSLMTFREVETLFHEMGHGLQHMLTAVTRPEAAGISNVEWDAVELPSQFLENWCYDPATILGREGRPGLARHWQTGAALPADLFARICAARTYRAGSACLRQLYFSQLDLDLHRSPGVDPLAVQRRVASANTVIPPLAEDRFLCSFTHIFSGGYAAGYYSYKWAEVLAADAFGAFIEAGLDDEAAVQATGRRFRDTVLALGGGTHPLEVFRRFRGREPQVAALLRQTGLT